MREDLGHLVEPTQAAPLAAYRGLGPDLRVEPVARAAASAPGLGGLELVGIDADALPALAGWRDDFSRTSPRDVGRLLARGSGATGPRIPADARALRIDASGVGVKLSLVALRGDGRGVVLDLGRLDGDPLSVPVPEEARGARLARLVVRPTTRVLERGADSGRALLGSFRLDGIEADGRPLDVASWVGEGGLDHEGTTVRYALTDRETALLRPPPSEPPPALATPAAAAAAASDGTLTLRVAGDAVRVRVAAVARRIPGTRGEAVVVDRRALQAAAPPGAAAVSEVWIGAPSAAAARAVEARLRRPPFDVLAVDSRAALARRLETDPLAEVTLATLVAAALVALGARRGRPRAARARRRAGRARGAARPRGAGRGTEDAAPAAARPRRDPRGGRSRLRAGRGRRARGARRRPRRGHRQRGHAGAAAPPRARAGPAGGGHSSCSSSGPRPRSALRRRGRSEARGDGRRGPWRSSASTGAGVPGSPRSRA